MFRPDYPMRDARQPPDLGAVQGDSPQQMSAAASTTPEAQAPASFKDALGSMETYSPALEDQASVIGEDGEVEGAEAKDDRGPVATASQRVLGPSSSGGRRLRHRDPQAPA